MSSSSLAARAIGRSALTVFPIGLGCASLSGSYGPADDVHNIALLHKALEIGVTHFDSSDKYGWGHNESLLANALGTHRDKIILASKFGNLAGRDGRIADGRPSYVMEACEASLKRLQCDYIDLYYQHRVDPDVPIEETVGAMGRLVEQGKVRALGLCEVNPTTLRRAHAIHPISAVQTEYSILYRDQAEDVLKTMRELGISLIAYAPLGRGLLTGAVTAASLGAQDERLRHPRFQSDNLDHNLKLVEQLDAIARKHNASKGQIALSWLLAQGPDIIPIPGTKTMSRMIENTQSAQITLDEDDLTSIAAAFPAGAVAGLRYRAEHMKNLYL